MWYVAACSFTGGFVTAFGVLFGVGKYAFTHPKVMQPIAKRMMHAMIKGGQK